MSRPLARASLLLAVAAAVRACDPADPAATCGFGGLCDAATLTCACRAEWSGPNCTNLNLAPARNAFAFTSPTANVSSWGGSAAYVARTGAYWLAVAVMARNCGLGSWESNSEIVLARSATPDGPYEPAQTLLAPFAHNPTLHALPNGSLVIAHIGSGVPEHPLITTCTNGTTPGAPPGAAAPGAAAPPARGGGLRLGVPGAALPPPNFLFLASGVPGDGSAWEVVNSTGGDWAANNPALLINPEDGSVILVYKVSCACPPPCKFCRQFGVATAPAWRGPYTDKGLIPVYGEDAYVWADPSGVQGPGYHMLTQGGNYAPIYPVYQGHFHTAFSPDGVSSWTVETGSEVFNTSIALESGGVVELARRERHQVLFDAATRAPAYLFNGAELAGSTTDHSFTVVQPIVRA